MIYSNAKKFPLPQLDVLTFLFESEYCLAQEDTPLHADAARPDEVITKRQSRDLTKQFAHFLRHNYGIGNSGPGKDVVVTLSTGQPALASFFYGVIAADGVYSAASPAATASDLARQLKDGPSNVLVCSRPCLEVSLAAAKIAGLPKQNVLILDSHPSITLESADGKIACDFKHSLNWRRITNAEELDNSKICFLYSSGTTGLPKAVLISHTMVVSEAYLPYCENRPVLDRLEKEGNPWVYRTVGHLPTAHIAGLQGYLINPIFNGGIVYWMPGFNFEDFVRYCGELNVTNFFSVPPIFNGIAKDPRVKEQFKHIRLGVSGAAPLADEIQDAVGHKFGCKRLNQTWGLSESCGSATHTPLEAPFTNGSLGCLLPNVEMRLVDEDEVDVPEGQPGEALLRGPVVTKGYHNNDEANANSFTEDGWFRTGDVLKMHKGELFLVDRKKELIKYKGLQVPPAELEGLLTGHPLIADAAVIGVLFKETEAPRAYISLVPSSKGKITVEEVIKYVKDRVSAHKQLRGGVRFIELVPRSPSGKILRRELREIYKKEARESKL